ncbi:MAG: class I SAM-dependent methyltransferase [Alphaproteobacteria bacterium]|nr:class I SAM-dependent methyltransferase [Alphaproteobacteria bacterium]
MFFRSRPTAWTKTHLLTLHKAASPFVWMKGYFYQPEKGPRGETYMRQNLAEVLTREIFVEGMGPIEGRRFLDVGCGAGDYMALIAHMGGNVSGIDLNTQQLERGRAAFASAGLRGDFVEGDARTLPFADGQFDVVYSADVFEHLSYETKQSLIAEMYRVLKPGGIVIIKTPNLDYLRVTIMLRRFMRLLRLKSPFIYIEHTRNNPDNEHHGLSTYRELNHLFGAQQFLEPETIHVPLLRGKLYIARDSWLPLRTLFNECIILRYRKSVFLPTAEMLIAQANPTLLQEVGT